MDLGGIWRAHVADDELRRTFALIDTPDDAWTHVTVPTHWRSVPEFAANDDPVLHRRRFSADAAPAGRRSWIGFDGIFYQGDVWLDGAYLGDTEGYFAPHTFEVTALRERKVQMRNRSSSRRRR